MSRSRGSRRTGSAPKPTPAPPTGSAAGAAVYPIVVMLVMGVCAGMAGWLLTVGLVAGGYWEGAFGKASPEHVVLVGALGAGVLGLHLGSVRSFFSHLRTSAKIAALVPLIVVDLALVVWSQVELPAKEEKIDLLAAAEADDLEAFVAAIEEYKASMPVRQQRDFDLRDRPDLLRSAARAGSHRVTAHIVAESSSVRPCDGAAALEAAVHAGKPLIVADLVRGGVDADAACGACRSEPAIYVAAWIGAVDSARILIDSGADLECPGLDQATPLMKAAIEGHLLIVEALLAKGAEVDSATAQGDTALTRAAEAGKLEVVQALVGAGAEVNPEGARRTPLMAAASEGHIAVIEALLAAGARVDDSVPGYRDQPVRAVDLAQRKSHQDVVDRLILAGAAPPSGEG